MVQKDQRAEATASLTEGLLGRICRIRIGRSDLDDLESKQIKDMKHSCAFCRRRRRLQKQTYQQEDLISMTLEAKLTPLLEPEVGHFYRGYRIPTREGSLALLGSRDRHKLPRMLILYGISDIWGFTMGR